MIDKNIFGGLFRQLRTKERITLREIAPIVGVNISTLATMEQGISPPLTDEQIKKFCQHFAIPPIKLLDAAQLSRESWRKYEKFSGDGHERIDAIEQQLEQLSPAEAQRIIPFLKNFITSRDVK